MFNFKIDIVLISESFCGKHWNWWCICKLILAQFFIQYRFWSPLVSTHSTTCPFMGRT